MDKREIEIIVSEIWDMAQLCERTDKTPFVIAKGGGRLKALIDTLTNPEKYLCIREDGLLIVKPQTLQ